MKPSQPFLVMRAFFILRLKFYRSAVMALMLAICALPSMATMTCTTVTSAADDGSLGTLRFAITQANAATCDTITFSLSHGAVISLAQGQLEISNTTTTITISGPGAANLAISGNNVTRIFLIDPGVAVSISGVTIENGNYAAGFGGGIYNNGTVTVTNCSLSGNIANLGGGIYNGGAATVTSSTFSGNSANAGGGIVNEGSMMTVTNSTFSGNSGRSLGGGGIYNGGTATVTNSTFSGNSAVSNYGGGIFNAAGTATVTNSTFSGNSASGAGGGIFNNGGATATVTNSTFSGNSGGSVFNNGGQPGGAVTLKNTLLTNAGPRGNCSNVPFGTFVSAGYNLSDDASCSSFFTVTGDVNNTPAGLDPGGLKNNGGSTQTIAILPSSPAFNVIPLSPTNYCTDTLGNPVSTDQRGISRPQVSACDIGAFEYSSDDDSTLAALSGGNSFSGDQTVNGNVTATSFGGNGSGLTGVNAATAMTASGLNCAGCVGNTQLAINYAAGDAQGGNALNALLFGGLLPSAFAPVSGSPNYAPLSGSTSYVAKAGDTMTGVLNLPANGLVAGGNQLVLSGGNVGIGTATPGGLSGYTSLHIDQPATGFGGAFLELSHSATGTDAKIVSDDNGFLLEASNPAPVKIKSGNFNGASDPGSIYISTTGNVGIGTGSPAATLEVNGTAKFDNTVTFAPGQTFPGSGSGTITGVSVGAGLSGGGTTGNVTISVDPTVARTNASNTFSAPQTVSGALTATSFVGNGSGLIGVNAATATTASGLTCAGCIGNTQLSVNYAGSSSQGGPASNALLLGGLAPGMFATLGSNSFTGPQMMPNLMVSGGVSAIGGISTTSLNSETHGTQPAINGQSTGTGSGPAAFFNICNGNCPTNGQPGLLFAGGDMIDGANGDSIQFRVDYAGNIATAGSVTIGGGTPIVEYVSVTDSITVPALTPGTCTTFTTPAVEGFTPGTSDTIALGTPSALVSNLGNGIFLVYQAWETTTSVSPTITIEVCNPTAVKYKGGASGTLRIDIFKH